jgi:hypothetical protein
MSFSLRLRYGHSQSIPSAGLIVAHVPPKQLLLCSLCARLLDDGAVSYGVQNIAEMHPNVQCILRNVRWERVKRARIDDGRPRS